MSAEQVNNMKDSHIVGEDITESVEELKARLETMKLLMEQQGALDEKQKRNYTRRESSIIDGTFLSAVFAVVFLIIVGVTIHAFQNLYFAISKKFPTRHTEL